MMSKSRFSARYRVLLTLAACVPLLGLASLEALFAPKKEPWPLWQAHDPASSIQVDHARWGRVLGRYLHTGKDGITLFDYAALKGDGLGELDAYLKGLEAVPVRRLTRPRQLAFWLNLYNALTVRTVARAYPVDSIRDIDISPGLFADGPWGKPLTRVEGEALTLNDIEHRIVRPLWNDPRVHYALNCASLGCPNLAPSPYRADDLETMLESAATTFINSPRALWWDDERLWVSSIYAWFQGDFGGDDAGILAHLSRYAEPDLRRRLARVERIRDHDYDWGLNAWR
jgi:hypothetical protein